MLRFTIERAWRSLELHGPAIPQQRERPAREVWAEAPANLTVRNLYFEWTPLAELSSIVTEQGALSIAEVEGRLAALKLHPALTSGAQASAGGPEPVIVNQRQRRAAK